MSASRFWELSVGATEDTSEGLTNFVWELGALGVVEEEIAGTARLRAFFPASARAEDLAAQLHDYLDGLRALGFAVDEGPCLAPVSDPGWAQAWRDHFQPRPVGGRLLVAPPWNAPCLDDRLTILIEPGRAFGTGQHGSTVGCLELLERVLGASVPTRAIDVGTGSGILAIAAARLGVRHILAIDADPDAVANAGANVALNGMETVVACALGDAAALRAEPAPLVLANILAAAHVRLAPTYRGLVAYGGHLILGGMLEGELDDTAAIVERSGFARCRALTCDGWASLELVRRP
jgi:ribosomal protein L11 methyltransferase